MCVCAYALVCVFVCTCVSVVPCSLPVFVELDICFLVLIRVLCLTQHIPVRTLPEATACHTGTSAHTPTHTNQKCPLYCVVACASVSVCVRMTDVRQEENQKKGEAKRRSHRGSAGRLLSSRPGATPARRCTPLILRVGAPRMEKKEIPNRTPKKQTPAHTHTHCKGTRRKQHTAQWHRPALHTEVDTRLCGCRTQTETRGTVCETRPRRLSNYRRVRDKGWSCLKGPPSSGMPRGGGCPPLHLTSQPAYVLHPLLFGLASSSVPPSPSPPRARGSPPHHLAHAPQLSTPFCLHTPTTTTTPPPPLPPPQSFPLFLFRTFPRSSEFSHRV